ncbi:SIMPL domain-containing protein [Gimesia sp.]|uniref:SIMPL domain-containing protein n=1 Tax=Gimesia sp. TaxID=2024833 RepID=UPI0032F06691
MCGKLLLSQSRSLFLLALALPCFAQLSPVAAEGETGITVVGTGIVEQKPTVVEMTGLVIGQGQLAGDAVTKYHGNRRRAEDAFKNLKIPGLVIQGDGMSLYSSLNASQMQAMMRGMAVNNTQSQELSVSETLKLRLTGVDKLSSEELLEMIVRIVDAGKDAGVVIGNDTTPMVPGTYNASKARNTMVAFKIQNVEDLKNKAYAKALEDARAQAEALAKLAGGKLGKVVAINTVDPNQKSSDSSSQMLAQYLAVLGMRVGQSEEQSSALLKEIPVSAVVRVTYALE